jgi:hypothetical protein
MTPHEPKHVGDTLMENNKVCIMCVFSQILINNNIIYIAPSFPLQATDLLMLILGDL